MTRGRDSRRSWYCGTVRSTSDFLARPRWRKAGSEPSLVVGFGHISCLMVASLRYQSKSSKPTSVPTLEVCLLQDYRFAQEHLFRRNLLSSVSTCEKRDREKKLAKKISFYERLRTPSEACPQRTLLRNESKGTITPRTRFAS